MELIYDHPFYLVGTLVTIAMYFVGKSLWSDIKHNHHHEHHHEFHTKHHDHEKHSKSLY